MGPSCNLAAGAQGVRCAAAGQAPADHWRKSKPLLAVPDPAFGCTSLLRGGGGSETQVHATDLTLTCCWPGSCPTSGGPLPRLQAALQSAQSGFLQDLAGQQAEREARSRSDGGVRCVHAGVVWVAGTAAGGGGGPAAAVQYLGQATAGQPQLCQARCARSAVGATGAAAAAHLSWQQARRGAQRGCRAGTGVQHAAAVGQSAWGCVVSLRPHAGPRAPV
eukprot:429051-Pelagomonas_calceolata.AAC.2